MTENTRNPENLPALQTPGQAVGPVYDGELETSLEQPRRIGTLMLLIVFGGFGLWSALAPIEGAAHAPGSVTVRSYKKLIQHLEGGIVREIRVQNGDHVAADDVLLVLDDTQAQAQREINNAQLIALTALEARLLAERDGATQIEFPASLTTAGLSARAEIDAQRHVFATRRATMEGSRAVLEQRIEQLRSRLVGLEAMRQSKEALSVSFAAELSDARVMLEEGFADKLRLRERERNLAVYQGEAAELVASISATQMQIGETQLQILQIDNEWHSEVASLLSETQTRLKDARERMIALDDILSRTVIRAPVGGIVAGMQYHTEGAVIGPGAPIAEVVPQSDELIIEARVSVADIDRVAAGQDAPPRFSSFSSSVPTIFGTVLGVSADAMADQTTGMPFYLARVAVTEEGMQQLGELALVPGMPAEVFIASGSRTFLQYVMKPFSNALARALRED